MGLTEAEADHAPVPTTSRELSAGADLLDRYRPAALAVTAILAVVTVLPGARPGSERASPVSPPGALAGSTLIGGPVPVTQDVTSGVIDVGAPPLGVDHVSLPGPVALPAFVAEPLPGVAGPGPGQVAAGAGPSRRPVVPVGAAPHQPLELRAAAWASRTAGTPLAAFGVPEQSLPIGLRLNVLDKASFVRLRGTTSMLVLTEVAGGQRGEPAAARLQACRIIEQAWQDEQAQSFEAAPSWDGEACVAGTRAADGRWTFDLSQFPARTDDHGFAVLPGVDAPADFQVALRRT